jgi:uncharacterized protein
VRRQAPPGPPDRVVDLTPLVPAGRQVIERYGAAGFRVAGVVHRGAALVFPDRTEPWTARSIASVTLESLGPVVAHGGVQILLIGLGRRAGAIPSALRSSLRASGIVVEPMDTAAACRTYNVLVGEDRRVAAALLPLV